MFDLYAEITDRIVRELESGEIPWKKPWIGTSAAIKHVGGKPYSLLNQFLLGEPGEYLSFKQCQQEGGKIKKGAKSKIVVFWKMLNKERTDAEGKTVFGKDGKPVVDMIPFLQYSNVFHIRDCEGISPKYSVDVTKRTDVEAKAEAEKIMCDYLNFSHVNLVYAEQNQAYYQPSTDTITLPLRKQFNSSAEFYSTAFHEMTHSTGHSSRLNRLQNKKAAFGNEEYSKEELVAEIGAATLVSKAGIETQDSFKNSAAYIQSWLKALKNDKRMIVSASGKAEKAVEYILTGKLPNQTAEPS